MRAKFWEKPEVNIKKTTPLEKKVESQRAIIEETTNEIDRQLKRLRKEFNIDVPYKT